MFKQALINAAETFLKKMSHKSQKIKDMTLKQKVDMYQRKEMVDGLMMPDTDKH